MTAETPYLLRPFVRYEHFLHECSRRAYYSHNAFFWAKIASFAGIGLLSVRPTITFIRWRNSGVAPDDAAIKVARGYLHGELAIFALLPIFAAAMARGYGEF